MGDTDRGEVESEPRLPPELEGPSLGADMFHDLAWWLAEAGLLLLALWVVAVWSDSLDFRDYFDEAAAIPLCAGLGWFERNFPHAEGEEWRNQGFRYVGLLLEVMALLAAGLVMPGIAFAAILLGMIAFCLFTRDW